MTNHEFESLHPRATDGIFKDKPQSPAAVALTPALTDDEALAAHEAKTRIASEAQIETALVAIYAAQNELDKAETRKLDLMTDHIQLVALSIAPDAEKMIVRVDPADQSVYSPALLDSSGDELALSREAKFDLSHLVSQLPGQKLTSTGRFVKSFDHNVRPAYFLPLREKADVWRSHSEFQWLRTSMMHLARQRTAVALKAISSIVHEAHPGVDQILVRNFVDSGTKVVGLLSAGEQIWWHNQIDDDSIDIAQVHQMQAFADGIDLTNGAPDRGAPGIRDGHNQQTVFPI